MKVSVKLMASLRDRTPEGGTLELADGATVNGMLEALEVPGDHVHLVMVNNQIEKDRERTLADDDELIVLPPVGAG